MASKFFEPATKTYSENMPAAVAPGQIEDAIEQILQQRKTHLDILEQTEENAIKMRIAFSSFREQCRIYQQDENLRQKVFGARAADFMRAAASFSENEAAELEDALEELNQNIGAIRNRFLQDDICIAILGKAGNGKSRLIQSITGLDDYTIPTSEKGCCTGTRMIIRNGPSYKATIHFLTKEDFLQKVIQRYADALNTGVRVSDVSDIHRVLQSIPQGVFESYVGRLKEYETHQGEYLSYLGRGAKRLTNSKEVREYVSQIGVNREKYYKFMAVDYVEVECPFPTSTVQKLMLVDSVGVNENTLNIQEDMLDIISNQADFVFYIKKMGDRNVLVDSYDWKVYRNICDRRPMIAPYKWLYFVFNRDERKYEDNFETFYCASVVPELDANVQRSIHPAGILNIDCSRVDEVRDGLISPMLAHISRYGMESDALLVGDVNKTIDRVNAAFAKFHQTASGLVLPMFDYNTLKMQMAANAFNEMVQNVSSRRNEYIDMILNSPEAQNWWAHILEITNDIEMTIPAEQDIQQEFERSGSALRTIERAFELTRNMLCAIFNKPEFDYTELSQRIQSDAARMLLEGSGLDQILPDAMQQQNPLRYIRERLFVTQGTEVLSYECRNMERFQITGRSTMTQMTSDAMRLFDPNAGCGNFPNRWEPGRLPEAIINSLAACMPAARNSMQTQIRNMISPYQQAATMVDNFITNIISHTVLVAWQTVFFEHADRLWHERLQVCEDIKYRTEMWNQQIMALSRAEGIAQILFR